jgi:hypothetical protein
MQTSLLLSFAIKLVTQGREGVWCTTTKHMHTIYEEAWQVDAWASTIDCPQRRSEAGGKREAGGDDMGPKSKCLGISSHCIACNAYQYHIC